MSVFWNYFTKTLRLPFILVGGPLAMLAEGAAESLDEVRDVIISLRDQFTPARCEDANLTRFAAARGIVQSPLEPDAHWQARVRFAYHWWASGGRSSALAEGLELGFGFDSADVVSLRSDDPARWASFRVILWGGSGDILTRLSQIRWAINEVKPARSLLTELKFYVGPLQSARHNAIAHISGAATVIYPVSSLDLDLLPPELHHIAICQTGSITTIYPGD